MTTTETRTPLGNEWEFSERNDNPCLQPGRGKRQTTQPADLLLAVIQHVQQRFIVDGWQFAAVVQNLSTRHDYTRHFIAIFTHPSRTDLLESWEPDVRKFIKPRFARIGLGEDPLRPHHRFRGDDPINDILRAANYIAINMSSGYHGIQVGQKGFWQTGVGIVDISLETYKQRISTDSAQIKGLMKQVTPLQERKAAMAVLLSPSPVPLFQRK